MATTAATSASRTGAERGAALVASCGWPREQKPERRWQPDGEPRRARKHEGMANDILVVLVDHSVFKAVPVEARAAKQLYDTRGMWR